MAWRRPGDKPLSEKMMVSLLTHICFNRPQWVKSLATYFLQELPDNKLQMMVVFTYSFHVLRPVQNGQYSADNNFKSRIKYFYLSSFWFHFHWCLSVQVTKNKSGLNLLMAWWRTGPYKMKVGRKIPWKSFEQCCEKTISPVQQHLKFQKNTIDRFMIFIKSYCEQCTRKCLVFSSKKFYFKNIKFDMAYCYICQLTSGSKYASLYYMYCL